MLVYVLVYEAFSGFFYPHFSIFKKIKKPGKWLGIAKFRAFSMELLMRFERTTSSLPRMINISIYSYFIDCVSLFVSL